MATLLVILQTTDAAELDAAFVPLGARLHISDAGADPERRPKLDAPLGVAFHLRLADAPTPLAAHGARLRIGGLSLEMDGPETGAAIEGGDVRIGDPALLETPEAGWPAVLQFWLEEVGETGWYRSDPAIDTRLARRFGDLTCAAALGRLAPWTAAPESALALLLLLDQFPRNLHRGRKAAFAADPLARRMATEAIAAGHDLAIPEPERQFFYLPFEHSEALADQERAVDLIAERCPNLPETLRHAQKHRELIAAFGRFPHRNAVLGRVETAEERRFLAEGGYRPGARPKG